MNQNVEDMLVSQVGTLIGHIAQLEYRVTLLEGESREVAAERVREVVERLTKDSPMSPEAREQLNATLDRLPGGK